MIDEEKTFELFGYYSYDLKSKSNKKVVCICNNCGKERILRLVDYRTLCRSCSNKGKHLSDKIKYKLSKLYSGKNNPMFGKHHSTKTKQKISNSLKGKCCGENHPMFGKIGKDNPNFGKHRSIKTIEKLSKVNMGKNNPNYIDGKGKERVKARRRNFLAPKFFLGDRYCKGLVAHHLTETVIIYIPLYIHRKNWHNLRTGKGMREINDLSLKFLLEGF